MTSKNEEFKTIMKNNQCIGNLAVMGKLMITTLTKFRKKTKAIGNVITSSRLPTSTHYTSNRITSNELRKQKRKVP